MLEISGSSAFCGRGTGCRFVGEAMDLQAKALPMMEEMLKIEEWLKEPARQVKLVLLLSNWSHDRNARKDFWHNSYHKVMTTRDEHFTGIHHRTAQDCVQKLTNGSVVLSADKAHRAIEGLSWLSRYGHLDPDINDLEEVRLVQLGLPPREAVSKEEIRLIKALHTWCTRGQSLYQVSPDTYDHVVTGGQPL